MFYEGVNANYQERNVEFIKHGIQRADVGWSPMRRLRWLLPVGSVRLRLVPMVVEVEARGRARHACHVDSRSLDCDVTLTLRSAVLKCRAIEHEHTTTTLSLIHI